MRFVSTQTSRSLIVSHLVSQTINWISFLFLAMLAPMSPQFKEMQVGLSSESVETPHPQTERSCRLSSSLS